MMKTAEIRKVLLAGWDDLVASHGYSRRRKADAFTKQGDGWQISVDLNPSTTYGRVKANLVIGVRIEHFETRLADVLGTPLYDECGSETFLLSNPSLTPENLLLALDNGPDDIPGVLQLIERAVVEVEDLAIRLSQDTGQLCEESRIFLLLRQGFACWENGNREKAAILLEEGCSGGPPEIREASALLLARLKADTSHA
jgi:hypothetical protein